jgi:hypothetical protein
MAAVPELNTRSSTNATTSTSPGARARLRREPSLAPTAAINQYSQNAPHKMNTTALSDILQKGTRPRSGREDRAAPLTAA